MGPMEERLCLPERMRCAIPRESIAMLRRSEMTAKVTRRSRSVAQGTEMMVSNLRATRMSWRPRNVSGMSVFLFLKKRMPIMI